MSTPTRSSACVDRTARPSLYETSQFRQILAIKLNWITNALCTVSQQFRDQDNRSVKTTTEIQVK